MKFCAVPDCSASRLTSIMKYLLLLLLIVCGSAQAGHRCCPAGQLITRQGGCDANGVTTSPNISCPNGRWVLKDVVLEGDKVFAEDAPNFVFVEDPSEYCLGEAHRNFTVPALGITPAAVICFQPPDGGGIEVTGVLTLISVVFLLLTLAVYLYLPQMRDLQGLCYISMCISMALGYLSLGVLQLSPGFRGEICTVTGFIVYFWMMATFFWMNVISINTYRSIDDATYLKKTEKQQYFRYSCYAWGGTMFFLVVALSANFVEGDHWKPGIGEGSCWFKGTTETWIFFYGPVAALVACNICLFVASSLILWRQTRKYEVDKLNNLKHKFLLSLKLFLVMGISWVFEIASFAHGQYTVIWKIMDTFNCLQGAVIFLLLVVLRRRAIRGLASENCLLPLTRPLADRLSPHDDEDDQQVLADDTTEVRLN